MRFFVVLILAVSAAVSTEAQAPKQSDGVMISPVISEGRIKIGKKGRGEFTIYNNKQIPVIVTVNAGAMTPKDKRLVFGNAPFGLRLDQTSVKIAPHQQWTFGYVADGIFQNSLLAFNVKIAGPHVDEGTTMALEIPVLDYVCIEKTKDCREMMLANWGMKHETMAAK